MLRYRRLEKEYLTRTYNIWEGVRNPCVEHTLQAATPQKMKEVAAEDISLGGYCTCTIFIYGYVMATKVTTIYMLHLNKSLSPKFQCTKR